MLAKDMGDGPAAKGHQLDLRDVRSVASLRLTVPPLVCLPLEQR